MNTGGHVQDPDVNYTGSRSRDLGEDHHLISLGRWTRVILRHARGIRTSDPVIFSRETEDSSSVEDPSSGPLALYHLARNGLTTLDM